jgi:hypothetical protein
VKRKEEEKKVEKISRKLALLCSDRVEAPKEPGEPRKQKKSGAF